MKSGTNTKPKVVHVCCVCHKVFPQRYRLLIHAATHSDERNFPCVVCQKRFKSKNSLSYHAYSHLKNGDIDSMDWFPELMTPSKRRQRSENKRSSPKESITPINLEQPIGSMPGADATMVKSHSGNPGIIQMRPIDGMPSQFHGGKQNACGPTRNKEQGNHMALGGPTYAIRIPKARDDKEAKNSSVAQGNESCSTQGVKKFREIIIVNKTTGQQYHVKASEVIGKTYGKEQSNQPIRGPRQQCWPTLVRLNETHEPFKAKSHYPQGQRGLHMPAGKVPAGMQGSNSMSTPFPFMSPQPPASGYNSTDSSTDRPPEGGQKAFKDYLSGDLEGLGATPQCEFQDLEPLKSSGALNTDAEASGHGQNSGQLPDSSVSTLLEPQEGSKPEQSELDNVKLVWSDESVISKLWNRKASFFMEDNSISSRNDARKGQLAGRQNGAKSFQHRVQELGDFDIEQTEIGYGIDGNAVYIRHRGFHHNSPEKKRGRPQNIQKTWTPVENRCDLDGT